MMPARTEGRMKIEMTGDGLADALGLVGSAVPTRAARPVLSNILIRAEPSKAAEIVGTNMEVGIRVRLDAAGTTGVGAILISHQRLSAIATELRGEKLKMEAVAGHKLKITSDGTSFELVGEDPEDFPKVPEMPKTGIIEIVPALFERVIRRTAFAAAAEETRYAIHGVLLEIEGERLRAIATDGKRLAMNEADDAIVAGKHNTTTALLPAAGLSATLRKAASLIPAKDKIEMVVEDRRAIFRCGPITIAMSKVEGTFPTWQEVIPKNPTIELKVDREELRRGIRRGALLATEGSQAVGLTISPDGITVGAKASNVGEGTIEVPILEHNCDAGVAVKSSTHDLASDPIVIHFNPRYVEQFLKVDDSQAVEMKMTGAKAAVLFVGADGFQYVVMPVTLEWTD